MTFRPSATTCCQCQRTVTNLQPESRKSVQKPLFDSPPPGGSDHSLEWSCFRFRFFPNLAKDSNEKHFLFKLPKPSNGSREAGRVPPSPCCVAAVAHQPLLNVQAQVLSLSQPSSCSVIAATAGGGGEGGGIEHGKLRMRMGNERI